MTNCPVVYQTGNSIYGHIHASSVFYQSVEGRSGSSEDRVQSPVDNSGTMAEPQLSVTAARVDQHQGNPLGMVDNQLLLCLILEVDRHWLPSQLDNLALAWQNLQALTTSI